MNRICLICLACLALFWPGKPAAASVLSQAMLPPLPHPRPFPTLAQATLASTRTAFPPLPHRGPLPRLQQPVAVLSSFPSPTINQTTPNAQNKNHRAPVRLKIPKLQIDAVVESAGQDPHGAMEIPRNVNNVAWYKLGATPGEIGNAVIAGHLDLATGAPGVFWSIRQLVPGDQINVVDEQGSEHNFVVTRQASYPYAQAPMEEIFGFTVRSRLNLITCNGQWDEAAHNYSQRLVVYSELLTDSKSAAPHYNPAHR